MSAEVQHAQWLRLRAALERGDLPAAPTVALAPSGPGVVDGLTACPHGGTVAVYEPPLGGMGPDEQLALVAALFRDHLAAIGCPCFMPGQAVAAAMPPDWLPAFERFQAVGGPIQ